MTGAGSASVAIAHEQDLAGSLVDEDSDGNTDYYAVGRNPTLSEGPSLSNQLQRMRDAGDVEAAESVAQHVDGTVALEATVAQTVHKEIEQLVFNDGGTAFTSGRCNSASLFTGVDYLDGTAERELRGCIPLSYEVVYEEGGMTTYSLNLGYAEEKSNTSITPTSITQVSDGDSVPSHGVSLTVDGTTVSKLQGATLSIDNIARFQWGPGRVPVDAVIGAVETELTLNAIFSGPDKLKQAYGGSAVSTPQDQLSSVAGSLDLSVAGNTVSTYSLPKLKPNEYSWSDLINAENNLTEDVTYHVNGGVSVA